MLDGGGDSIHENGQLSPRLTFETPVRSSPSDLDASAPAAAVLLHGLVFVDVGLNVGHGIKTVLSASRMIGCRGSGDGGCIHFRDGGEVAIVNSALTAGGDTEAAGGCVQWSGQQYSRMEVLVMRGVFLSHCTSFGPGIAVGVGIRVASHATMVLRISDLAMVHSGGINIGFNDTAHSSLTWLLQASVLRGDTSPLPLYVKLHDGSPSVLLSHTLGKFLRPRKSHSMNIG